MPANTSVLPFRSSENQRIRYIPSVGYDEIPFVACLSDGVRKKILKTFTSQSFDAGEVIVSRGDRDNDVYFIQSGTAKVINYSDSGRGVAYATLQPGAMFGELAALDGQPRSATVVAKTDCSLGVMSGEDFLHVVTKYEALSLYVLRRLAGIIRGADEKIENLSLMGAEQRICIELLRYLEPDPGNRGHVRVYPVPTQVALADSIGVTRQTVARIFSRLFKEKTIERRGKSLFVLNFDKLEEYALHIKAT